MATLITDADRNALANNQAARMAFLSLHTSTPGTSGAAEATGGTPLAYARQAPTFTSAGATGALGETLQPATTGKAWSNEVTFNVPAGTYSYWGSFSSGTGGTFQMGNLLDTEQTPGSQAAITLSISIGPIDGA